MRLKLLPILTTLAAVMPMTAIAQETTDVDVVVVEKREPGVQFDVGGGIYDFTNNAIDDVTKNGGMWEARVVGAPHAPLAIEGAYMGALNDTKAPLAPDADAQILTSNAQAMFRANVLQFARNHTTAVRPYLAGGVGYTNQRLIGDDRNDPGVRATFRKESDAFMLPAAAGVDADLGHGVEVGARVAYNYIFRNDIQADRDKQDLSAWGATAHLGLIF